MVQRIPEQQQQLMHVERHPTYLGGVHSAGVGCVLQQCDPEIHWDVVCCGDLVRAGALGEQVAWAHPRMSLRAQDNSMVQAPARGWTAKNLFGCRHQIVYP